MSLASALPGQGQHVAQVQALLAAGQAGSAAVLARQLCAQVPNQAAHWQLLARACSASGDSRTAGQAYARAHALAQPTVPPLLAIEYAQWLQAHQGPTAACRVLASCLAHTADSRLLLARLAIAAGDQPLALQQLPLLHDLAPVPATAVNALIGLYQQHGLLGAAEQCLQQRLAGPAATPGLGLTLARLQRERGAAQPAMATVQQCLQRWPHEPILADLRSGLLLDLGQPEPALACARDVCASHPQYLPGLTTLANLLWEHGPRLGTAEHPASPLLAALRQAPQHKALRIELVSFLHNMGEHGQALQALRPLLNDSNDSLAQWYLGNLLASTDQLAQAELAYQRAERGFARHPALLNARARLALRRQCIEQAGQLAQRALACAPHDQEAWSLLSLVWRLQGDARYHWLCDYERLVAHLPVHSAPGQPPITSLLPALRLQLGQLHQGSGQPLVQSVRRGSQTSGRLFGRDEPVLQATQAALCHTARQWLASLPADPRHPFLSRRRQDLRIVGSWSVAMAAGGHHANHIHSQGWLSSAFHVSVADTDNAGDNSGCLQLGQPLHSLGLDLPAQRCIVPRAGWLALFPSYLWHGTVPVQHDGQRLSIAFDAQPADCATAA